GSGSRDVWPPHPVPSRDHRRPPRRRDQRRARPPPLGPAVTRRTPASAWATAPTREELLTALQGCLNAIDGLTMEMDVFPPVEADRARDLLRRAEAAKRAAQAAEAA